MIDNLNIRDERIGRGKSTRRQTVLSGRKGSVHADFIEATGLSPVIKASPTDPVIATIAKGFNKFGTEDKVIEITADVSYGPVTPNATNFLAVDENKSPVTSVLPPVYGNIFSSDRENKINASFNGTNGDTEFVDEYGNFFRAYGTGWQISNVNQYSGMNTARCDSIAAGNRWEVTPANLDNRSLDQWTIEMFYRFDSFATPQNLLYTSSGGTAQNGLQIIFNTSGQPILYYSNNESTYNIWPGLNTTNMNAIAIRAGFGDIAIGGAAHTAAQWYHMAFVYDGLTIKYYLNGYLLFDTSTIGMSEVFTYLKPAKFNAIVLGAEYSGTTAGNQLIGNISNFAFHPYAKYSTKKVAVVGDTPAVRDIFTPPTVPLSLTTQSDRYYEESEAIYLDFESASADDTLTKDLYGRQLTAGGNNSVTLTTGAYIESGAAKFGTKSLYFSGTASQVNSAYIKAPVWADKWTVEFWGKLNTVAVAGQLINSVVPGVLGTLGFGVYCVTNGAQYNYSIALGTTDSSADILNYSSPQTYTDLTYFHVAVSYDGITYRFFINGNLLTSVVSQLKVVQGSHFIFGRNSANSGGFLQGRIDDFAYVPYCKYGSDLGFVPPTQALGSTMPDQYVFDTKKMQMYKGYPTAFVPENTVFIGEALASLNKIEQVITYALNGEYREQFSYDFIGPGLVANTQTRKHNIGVNSVFGKVQALTQATGSNTSLVRNQELVDINQYFTGTSVAFSPYSTINRNIYGIRSGTNGFTIPSYSGTYIPIDTSGSQYLVDLVVVVQRGF
jgi:hypothetical protein